MFAWICPKCGKEIPPQYDGCPEWCPEYDKQKAYLKNTGPSAAEATSPVIKNLANIDRASDGGVYGAAAAAPPPVAAEPVGGPRVLPAGAAVSYETDVPAYSPRPESAVATQELRPDAQPKREMNPFVVTILAAVVFVALGYAGFKFYERSKGAPGVSANLVGAPEAAGTHRLNRILSVTGLRFVPGKNKQMEARFLIVNSSGAQTPNFSGTVYVRPKEAAADENPMMMFDVSKVALGPYESREMQAPLKTALKAYELPDGNLIRADLVITDPAE